MVNIINDEINETIDSINNTKKSDYLVIGTKGSGKTHWMKKKIFNTLYKKIVRKNVSSLEIIKKIKDNSGFNSVMMAMIVSFAIASIGVVFTSLGVWYSYIASYWYVIVLVVLLLIAIIVLIIGKYLFTWIVIEDFGRLDEDQKSYMIVYAKSLRKSWWAQWRRLIVEVNKEDLELNNDHLLRLLRDPVIVTVNLTKDKINDTLPEIFKANKQIIDYLYEIFNLNITIKLVDVLEDIVEVNELKARSKFELFKKANKQLKLDNEMIYAKLNPKVN